MSNHFDLDRIDTRLFKAFKAAADTLNFTHAAKIAAMTQSGMSQHISKLEEQLGVPLFKRLPKSVQLTSSGRALAAFIDRFQEQVDKLLDDVSSDQQTISGRVSYAMPSSCLASPHLGQLLQRRAKEAPELILDIQIMPNAEIVRHLLLGEIDFGFVTEKPKHPQIKAVPYCDEEFVLVSKDAFPEKLTREQLLEHDFITFPGMEVYFDAWASKYFPTLRFEHLRLMGSISTLEGAFKMIAGGVGWAVIPRHALFSSLVHEHIHVYEKAQLSPTNRIYVASLAGQLQPRRVDTIISWFLDLVKKETEVPTGMIQ